MVTDAEMDRAIACRRLQVTRANARPVRCVSCRALCAIGEARRLWLDGHKRGFLCLVKCLKALGQRIQ